MEHTTKTVYSPVEKRAIHAVKHEKVRSVGVWATIAMSAVMLSACAMSGGNQSSPYSYDDYYVPQSSVGTGDIHALDGNLVW